MQQALDDLNNDRLDMVAENLLTYYDRSYRRNMDRRPDENTFVVVCGKDNPTDNAHRVRKAAQQILAPGINTC